MNSLTQHQLEIEKNLRCWNQKPLLQKIYGNFYDRILDQINPALPGRIAELGSGIGNLKIRLPGAVCTDLFPNPWVDLVCDGYELPFRSGSLSHLILFDVFHHLEAPLPFLNEARRVLIKNGRLIMFEPFISWSSYPVYGCFHHEPVGMNQPLNLTDTPPNPRGYYAAQGNATRVFFRGEHQALLIDWSIVHVRVFSAFSYLFSGGYSKPAFYPEVGYRFVSGLDRMLSRWPKLFGGRCLVVLSPEGDPQIIF